MKISWFLSYGYVKIHFQDYFCPKDIKKINMGSENQDEPLKPINIREIFTQKNPLPDVATFRLGPRAGRAVVSTRVRLADTQTVIAIAEMSDGSFWSGTADTVVTLASCLEEL